MNTRWLIAGLCGFVVSGCVVGLFLGKTVEIDDVTKPTNFVFTASVAATNVTGVRLFICSHLSGIASLILGNQWSHFPLTNNTCINWSSDWDTNMFRVGYFPANVTGGTLTIKYRFETR